MKQTLMVAVVGAIVAGDATIALAQADVIKDRQETASRPPRQCAPSRALSIPRATPRPPSQAAAKIKTLESRIR